MEYGVAIKILNAAELKPYENTQNLALRTIFNADGRISKAALHKLLLTESFQVRNLSLHLGFCSRIHNGNDISIPAVNMWWKARKAKASKSLSVQATKSKWWKKGDWNKNFKANVKRLPAMAPSLKKELIKESIIKMDKGKPSVAGVIQIERSDRLRTITRQGVWDSNKQRITITRWAIGAVARHQMCSNCEEKEDLSRAHAVECSGAGENLRRQYGEFFNPSSSLTIIDQLLNLFRNGMPRPSFFRDLEEAIGLIFNKCRGLVQNDKGFWVESLDESNQPSRLRGELTGRNWVSSNPARSRRQAEIARWRNLPVGRPPNRHRTGVG